MRLLFVLIYTATGSICALLIDTATGLIFACWLWVKVCLLIYTVAWIICFCWFTLQLGFCSLLLWILYQYLCLLITVRIFVCAMFWFSSFVRFNWTCSDSLRESIFLVFKLCNFCSVSSHVFFNVNASNHYVQIKFCILWMRHTGVWKNFAMMVMQRHMIVHFAHWNTSSVRACTLYTHWVVAVFIYFIFSQSLARSSE